MTDRIQKAIADLHDVLNEEVADNVTACRIFISSGEHSIEVEAQIPAQLADDGVSMKNIRGEWIRQ